jgi:glucokinase
MSGRDLLLGLDFGGTKLTAGLAMAGQNKLLARAQCPTPVTRSARAVFFIMIDQARALLRDAGQLPAAVGVSFGGPVDAAEGRVLTCHHLPGWEDVPLRDWVEETLDAPAVVENDANAAAMGEWRFGRGGDAIACCTSP